MNLYYNRIKNWFKKCGSVKCIHEEQGATGTSAGRQRLEIIESADVVLHVAWY
jgi:hypothetical protein